MQKQFEYEWFGLPFYKLNKISQTKQADTQFYDAFYQEFFKKYQSVSELPKPWLESKKKVAEELYLKIKSKRNILSIGCGFGFIEGHILKKWDGKLTGIEPSKFANKWLAKIHGLNSLTGTFPQVFGSKNNAEWQFDLAYCSGIDYLFTQDQYIAFLQSIKKFGIQDLILTELSFHHGSIKNNCKNGAKAILGAIGIKRYNRKYQQFWGYQRKYSEHLDALRLSGFRIISDNETNPTIIYATVMEDK